LVVLNELLGPLDFGANRFIGIPTTLRIRQDLADRARAAQHFLSGTLVLESFAGQPRTSIVEDFTD
jgi:hypothetical protein